MKDHDSAEDVVRALCAEHRLTLVDVAALPKDQREEMFRLNGEDAYIERSFIGGREITLGIYENRERRLISFFHEFGHLLTSDTSAAHRFRHNKLLIEVEAWSRGIELAIALGIVFSDDAIAWGYTQALTYANYA